MNRAEKERKVQMQDGKVFEINNLTIVERYLNPNYSLLKQDSAVLGTTGRLDTFEVRPNSGGGPSFSGRWDGGSRDQGKKDRQDLDIDIEGVSWEEEGRFKNGENGYAGHHTKQVANTGARVYEVSIQTPSDGKIFEGTVSFSVHRRMEFKASMTSFEATVDAVQGRGNQAGHVQRKKKRPGRQRSGREK
jgi:hypothetical protein